MTFETVDPIISRTLQDALFSYLPQGKSRLDHPLTAACLGVCHISPEKGERKSNQPIKQTNKKPYSYSTAMGGKQHHSPRASSTAELSLPPWLSMGLAHLLLSFLMKSDSDMGLGLWQVSGGLQIHLRPLMSQFLPQCPLLIGQVTCQLGRWSQRCRMGFLALSSPEPFSLEVLQAGQRAGVVLLKVFLEWRMTGAIFGIFPVLFLSNPMCFLCFVSPFWRGGFPKPDHVYCHGREEAQCP